MTDYTGTINFTKMFSNGAGTFSISGNGSLEINLTAKADGTESGTANLSGLSVSGSEPLGDGFFAQISDSFSGTAAVAFAAGTPMEFGIYGSPGGSLFAFDGTIASATTITGTAFITLGDFPDELTIPISLTAGSPTPTPTPPPPIAIKTPQDIVNAGSVTNSSSTISTSIATLETVYDNVLEPGLKAYLGASALASSTAKLQTLLNSINEGAVLPILQNTESAESFVFKAASETTFLPAVGPVLAAVSTWSTALDDYHKNGRFTDATQKAGVEALAGIVSGAVGAIVVAGAETMFAGGLALAAGGAAPLIGAVVLGAAAAYLINGTVKELIDGVVTSGFQGEAAQAANMGLFGGKPLPSASLPAAAGAAATSVPAGFAGPLPFSVGQAAPQPAWTFDMTTGAFTWLAASTAPLTQTLSQLGVSELAAPLTITGSSTGALITGGPLGDHLNGGAGNDLILGGGGGDTISAGAGNNILDGGSSGRNTLDYSASPGPVIVNLAMGTAQNGFGGSDSISDFQAVKGSAKADTITGDGADNVLFGLAGADTLDGGAGSDTVDYSKDATAGGTAPVSVDLSKGTGVDGFGATDKLISIENVTGSNQVGTSKLGDILIGDAGANILAGLGGPDTLNGGGGSDTADYSQDAANGGTAPVVVDLSGGFKNLDGFGATDTLISIENITGTNQIGGNKFGDVLVGDSGPNVISGLGGPDYVDGGPGDDTLTGDGALVGGLGNDSVTGGAGNDVILLGDFNNPTAADGSDIAFGGGGDLLWGYGGNDQLHGGDGNDILVGNDFGSAVTGRDTMFGDAGDDIFFVGLGGSATMDGGTGNDKFFGGPGNDVMIGGPGSDFMYGAGGADTFVFHAADLVSGDSDIIYFFSAADGDTLQFDAAVQGLKVTNTTLVDFQSGASVAGVFITNGAGWSVSIYGINTTDLSAHTTFV